MAETEADLDDAMADLTPAGVRAVRARLRAGRMTDATLDALEANLIKRGSVGGAWQMCLIAEVRHLRTELAEERLRTRTPQPRASDSRIHIGNL